MVEGELMCTKGFVAFIRAWHTYNTASANKRSVFVPGFEYNLIPDDIQKVFHPMLIEKENVSIYYDVKNYEELFAQQNVQGPYLFLSKSLEPPPTLASLESWIYVCNFGFSNAKAGGMQVQNQPGLPEAISGT